MKGILKAIYEHEKKGLWYSKLNDLVKKTKYLGPNLSDSSFRTAMKTLRKIRNIIIEKPSDSKRKKLLIHLPPETKEEYPFFFSVPDSYSIEKFKVMSERRQKLTEYFLFGAATGTAYSRTAVGSEMIPGQVISFLNKEGTHSSMRI